MLNTDTAIGIFHKPVVVFRFFSPSFHLELRLASLYLHQMQKYPDGGCLPDAFINHHRSSRSHSDDIIPRASILGPRRGRGGSGGASSCADTKDKVTQIHRDSGRRRCAQPHSTHVSLFFFYSLRRPVGRGRVRMCSRSCCSVCLLGCGFPFTVTCSERSHTFTLTDIYRHA